MLMLRLAALIGVAALLAWLGAALYPTADAAAASAEPVILPKFAGLVLPEPRERFVFLAVSAITAALALAAALLRPRGLLRVLCVAPVPIGLAVQLALGGLLAAGLSRFDFGPSLLQGETALGPNHLRTLMLCGLAAAASFALTLVLPRGRERGRRFGAALAAAAFVAAMALQIGAWRIVGEASVAPGAVWSIHWDAVAYAISQVAAGRTLLVDLPSQYGLYPEIIGRIFRLIPFSVLGLSLIFALLQVIGLCAVFAVLLRETRSLPFRLAFALALVLVTFETVIKINGIPEFYFQYWPLRFFWPALSVLAFHAYAARRSLGRAASVSLVAAIGTVWNADTGLMIVGAFGGFLLVKWFVLRVGGPASSAPQRRHLLQASALHLGLLALVIGASALALLAGGGVPKWSWLGSYARIFYDLGLNMLPLPIGVTNPWMSVLAAYLAAILVALAAWRRTPNARSADLLFFLGLLGWGLFVYYQGRSHILNLVTVCWPALMIAAILGDRTLRMVRAGGLSRLQLVLPVAALGVLFSCALPFLQNVGALARDMRAAFVGRGVPTSPLVADELAFIRSHTMRGETCVILAQRQGLYYAAAGLRSPLEGPGYVEMLTIADRDDLLRQIETGRFSCVFVAEGPDTALDLGVDLMTPFRDYTRVAVSPMGSLVLLRAEPATQGGP
ncbi:hypothetical protein [Prosthecomicrobium pneumaticum]|uniref:Glycosyltransferase RgtA/B/C/D-like domain-containing protein n=1 Tax=Prosthecomicrobium pneumaticum TaxID=81895 RepID=A0A7W9L2W5_9HYPH|nr:hypothetical protein [Prosthecomicrobium pneumaticum]MBB5753950.1 hypothetical protein [Prosthecomicrobium pneumaticum]